MELAKERHVLAIYPHPDDETFGKAGTLALYTRAGVPVTVVCATLGQMGRNMGSPFFATRETLPKLREKELRDACAVLGVTDLRLMGLRDKTLEFEDPEALADQVVALIRDIRPSVVMSYYPNHGVHPDHDALSAAVVRAVAKLPKDERPVVHASPVTRNAREVLGAPDIELDVNEVMDIKMDAIRAHRSQSEAMLERMTKEMAADEAVREQIMKNFGTENYWIYPVQE